MARTSRPSDNDELTATARTNWHIFTQYVVKACVVTAAVLLLMLLVFKVL